MPQFFDPVRFWVEIAYTVIVVLFCFLIYFKTRESYELTKHKGIRYFRDAFLFFGLSYLMRFITSAISLYFMGAEEGFPRGGLFPISLLLMSYLSTIGIFYLLFSSMWKKVDNRYTLILGHVIAVLLSIVAFITRSQDMLILLQSALLILTTIIIFITKKGMHKGITKEIKKDKKSISQTKILYGLILVLWLINLWVIVPRGIMSFEIKIMLQLLSIIVFVLTYYKVSKWVK